LFSYIF